MGNSISGMSVDTVLDAGEKREHSGSDDEAVQPLRKKKKTEPKQYFINTKALYKIWFSKDKDTFLPQKNQLRLIRTRLKNPDAIISLVYSSKTLSEKALAALQAFCQCHDIKPVDFDTEVRSLTNGANERALYRLAKMEIERDLNNTGGNVAAASDIVRLMTGVIEKCGIYSDFDVDVDFSSLPEHHAVLAPVIFPADPVDLGTFQSPSANNEFFAVCCHEKNKKIHKDAKCLIQKIQEKILKNYSEPKNAILLNSVFNDVDDEMELMPYYPKLLEELYEENNAFTVFDLREKIKLFDARQLLKCIPLEERRMKTLLSYLNESEIQRFSDKYLGESNTINLGVKSIFKIDPRDLNDDLDTMSDEEVRLRHKMIVDLLPESMRNSTDDIIANSIHKMHLKTVIKITGPLILIEVFKEYLAEQPKLVRAAGLFGLLGQKTLENRDDWNRAMEAFSKHNTKTNALQTLIQSKNTANDLTQHLMGQTISNPVEMLKNVIGKFGDQSWSVLGKEKMQQSEEQMHSAAKLIQTAYRRYKQEPKLANVACRLQKEEQKEKESNTQNRCG